MIDLAWPGGGYPVMEHGSDKHEFTVWIPQAYRPRIGDWICPPEIMSNNGSFAVPNNTLRGTLILLQRKMRFDRIGAYVNTAGAAGAAARLGIYNVNPSTYYPSSLVLDAGVIACAVSGHKELVINQILSKGWYALVIVTNDATIVWRFRDRGLSPLGGDDSSDLVFQSWNAVQAYGALPANYPAGATKSVYRIPSLRVAELL